MHTEYIEINEINFDETVNKASELIREGKLVVFPTETVYGLGADGLNGQAVRNVYAAKGRPLDNPVILHVSSIEMLDRLVVDRPEISDLLIEKFWPGPLTMIFKKSNIIPKEITAGLDTVAVRMPNRKFTLSLIKASDTPLAGPSANTSGKSSPTSGEHCRHDLDGKVDMIVSDGDTEVGLESTVIDLSVKNPMILRPGAVTFEMLRAYIPNLEIDSTILESSSDLIPKSPGQKYKHYAPDAEALLFTGGNEEIVRNMKEYIAKNRTKKIGVLSTTENVSEFDRENVLVLDMGSRDNLNEVAHRLFGSLREFDRIGVDLILCEGFEENEMGLAVMNRLKKACSNKIIKGENK
ncbi:MAG: threonylcarbamoyl-AMP synthase [Tissierellia bacterium]|nr:threonylcarbamoyl-AMP synthase [Tissierellia bacterium]